MKTYEIVLPSKFVDMDAHQMEYDGSLGWAGRFFIAGIVFAVAGGGCLLLNRVFDIGDKDTMTGITLGAFGASLVCLCIGGLVQYRSTELRWNLLNKRINRSSDLMSSFEQRWNEFLKSVNPTDTKLTR